jgi:hypothetical protein
MVFMRAILLAGAAALTFVALSGCDQITGNKTAQQVAPSVDCHCLRENAPPPEHLARLAPPEYPEYTAPRYRRYAADYTRHEYESYAQVSETFVDRSYSSASGTYFDAESGYGSGHAYGAHEYRDHGWQRPPQGRGYWIDGYNRAHFISRKAELAAAVAGNTAVNSEMDHRTWFGYDKDCPEAFGQDGY